MPSIKPEGSQTVSTFDLEPNPFEQSFASKDTSQSSSGGNQVGHPKPPVITSPAVLTPGGTRKLPPLGLSGSGAQSPGALYNNMFLLNKTGLTPNESSLRSGLTPGGPLLGNLLGGEPLTPGLSSLLNFKPSTAAPLPAGTGAAASVTSTSTSANNVGSVAAAMPLIPPPPTKASASEKRSNSEGDSGRKKRAKVEPEETDEDKRQSFLERNRVAASKCRQRKKEYLKRIENEVTFYRNERDQLADCVDSVRTSLLQLKDGIHQGRSIQEMLSAVNTALSTIEGTSYAERGFIRDSP